jgi:hypothetical protein
MALRGTLGDFSLADILQLIGLQRKTGILVLRHGDEQVTVGFEDGRVVAADSSERPAELKIGQLLIRRGKLSASRLDEALRVQKETLQRLGHVLAERKWIDRDTMRRQLTLQITETVYGLFRWHGGEYDFQPQDRIEWDRDFVQPIPAEHLLMEGARMVDEWPIIERVLPDQYVTLRPTRLALRVLATSSESQEGQGSIYDQDIDFGFIPADPLMETEARPRLSPIELQVLRWVDGKRPAYEVAELTELGAFDAFKTMARLIELRLLERAEAEQAPERREQSPTRGWLRSAAPAKAGALLLAGLAVVGSVAALWQFLLVIRPDLSPARLPTPLFSAGWIEDHTGLARLRQAISSARMNRIEQAIEVYYLDTTEWPNRLSDLVDAELLAAAVTIDPWGRPYRHEGFRWGYRLSQEPLEPGSRAITHERRYTALQQQVGIAREREESLGSTGEAQ